MCKPVQLSWQSARLLTLWSWVRAPRWAVSFVLHSFVFVNCILLLLTFVFCSGRPILAILHSYIHVTGHQRHSRPLKPTACDTKRYSQMRRQVVKCFPQYYNINNYDIILSLALLLYLTNAAGRSSHQPWIFVNMFRYSVTSFHQLCTSLHPR